MDPCQDDEWYPVAFNLEAQNSLIPPCSLMTIGQLSCEGHLSHKFEAVVYGTGMKCGRKCFLRTLNPLRCDHV
jgi:hypothetical protein